MKKSDLILQKINRRYFQLKESASYEDKVMTAVAENVTGIITTYLKIQDAKVTANFVENPFNLTVKIYVGTSDYMLIDFDRNFAITDDVKISSSVIRMASRENAELIKILYAITNSEKFLATLKETLKQAVNTANTNERDTNEIAAREPAQPAKAVETPGLTNATPPSARGEA